MVDEQEPVLQDAIERLNQQFSEIAKQQRDWLTEALARLAGQNQRTMMETLAPALESPKRAAQWANEVSLAIYETMTSGISRMLSAYAAHHVFMRCPECGRQYAISDPDLGRGDLFECYQQRRGKECWIECHQALPQDYARALKVVHRQNQKPPCPRRFTLHEGLVEYKAQAPTEWFSRGVYTLTREGVVDLKIGQAVQLRLPDEFSWIDYVILVPRQTASGALIRTQWYRTGRDGREFVILTCADHEEDIGRQTKVHWNAVGLRTPPEHQVTEPWRRFLVSSARTLLYEHDTRMSVLESWMAFELFLDEFTDANWDKPHLKDNLEYLQRVAGHSILTKVRIVLHEALDVQFVNSTVWKDWNWARAFRNQVAHGGRLQETTYQKKNIGQGFENEQEIAKFCYRAVVRAIYFVRYWS